jgi:hypothetical protein
MCTIDNVVFLRNRIFPGIHLLIYTDNELISQYYTTRGYTVLPKSSSHTTLKTKVLETLKSIDVRHTPYF